MINKVIEIGKLTKDIEVQKTTTGKSVCNFSIAVPNGLKRQDGSREADFFNCRAWELNADNLGKYGRKGNDIAIEGKLTTDSYKDKMGNKVSRTVISLDKFKIFNFKTDTRTEVNQDEYSYPMYDDEPLDF